MESGSGGPGERIVSAVAGSADFVFRLVNELNLDCDAGQDGWIHPTTSPRKLDELARDAEIWGRFGNRVALLGGEQTGQRAGVEGYVGSMVAASGGTIHPVRFVHAMAILHEDRVMGMRAGKRDFGLQIEIRCWDSVDARKATPTRLPWKTLERITGKILGSVPAW